MGVPENLSTRESIAHSIAEHPEVESILVRRARKQGESAFYSQHSVIFPLSYAHDTERVTPGAAKRVKQGR